jgi:hypothetical protein
VSQGQEELPLAVARERLRVESHSVQFEEATKHFTQLLVQGEQAASIGTSK